MAIARPAGTDGAAQHRCRALDALGAGGDAVYLGHWMRQSVLAALLPSLERTVWVGLSAGSMVMTPGVGDEFVEMKPSITGSEATLGIVPFSIFTHMDHPGFDENTMACAERWAAGIGGPAYAIDDQTGIQVVDGQLAVYGAGIGFNEGLQSG